MSDTEDEEFQEFLRNGGANPKEESIPINPEDTTTGKEAGNKFFKEENFAEAVKAWATSLRSCEYILTKGVFDGEKLKEVTELRKTLWANLSVGYLKMRQFGEAVKYCDKVLKEEATNVKVMFRKAQALFELGELETAKRLVNELSVLDPVNNAVKQLNLNVEAAIRKYEQKSRKMMSGLFDRLESDTRTDEAEAREEDSMPLFDVCKKRSKRVLNQRGIYRLLNEDGQRLDKGELGALGEMIVDNSYSLLGTQVGWAVHIAVKSVKGLMEAAGCCKRRNAETMKAK
eukprot:GDKJ01049059.1.p1 GENE.GDKJ01049059.1~~GDKJ01049059.1.p1  ORF type:complete len:287 (-),score=71.66 GDKJ01049059.1:91-951(-)